MITLGLFKTEFAQSLVNQTIATRLPEWIYWATVDIISSYDFWWNKKKASFTTADSIAEYFLSNRVNGKQIIWMGDESNQTKEITEVQLEDLYRMDSTPTDTGDPIHWAYVDQSEVQAANTATTVSVVSSSSMDSSTTVIVRGKVSGIDRYESLSLNGTTPVAGTLTWDADTIEGINLSDKCTGVITMTTGATTIAAIPPGFQRLSCPRIRLWHVPSEVFTIPYIFYQRPMKPVNDSDIIDLPDNAFKAVMSGVDYYGYKNNGDIDFAKEAKFQFEQDKRDLYSQSTRELNKIYRKQFGVSWSNANKWCLPRTISASVSS